ncbi:molybdate ABC transporter substrate-binding protein [Echinicola sediminis]
MKLTNALTASLKCILLSGLLISLLGSCQSSDSGKLVIATAANMQFAMKALTQEFTKQTGVACDLAVSSSGKLTAQIKAGAPYDVFVAANMKYPQAVYDAGMALEHPKVYAKGRLVLWTMMDDYTPSLALLTKDSVEYIAVANPKTAPYGAAAMEIMEKTGRLDKLKEKLVYGESIAQTNQFIISKATEIGFTAMSVVLSPEMKGKGKWVALSQAQHFPIEQGIVLINRKDGPSEKGKKFLEFIFSEKAKSILQEYGYVTE